MGSAGDLLGTGLGLVFGGPVGGFVGHSLFGGGGDDKGGGGSGSDQADALTQMATHLFNQTETMRADMINNWQNMIKGDYDVTKSPQYDASKYNLETNYGTARENIMEQLPSGGALLNNLAQLETKKAGDLTNAASQIWQDEYNKAYGLATGAPQIAANAYTGAGGINAQNYQSKLGKTGDLGMGLGYFLGGK